MSDSESKDKKVVKKLKKVLTIVFGEKSIFEITTGSITLALSIITALFLIRNYSLSVSVNQVDELEVIEIENIKSPVIIALDSTSALCNIYQNCMFLKMRASLINNYKAKSILIDSIIIKIEIGYGLTMNNFHTGDLRFKILPENLDEHVSMDETLSVGPESSDWKSLTRLRPKRNSVSFSLPLPFNIFFNNGENVYKYVLSKKADAGSPIITIKDVDFIIGVYGKVDNEPDVGITLLSDLKEVPVFYLSK